jgi:hypothetical protein
LAAGALVVTHGGTLWCFRYVLERWTYEEAERRFRDEPIRTPRAAHVVFRGHDLLLVGRDAHARSRRVFFRH